MAMLFGDASKEKDSFVTLCSMSGEPKTTSDFTINFLTKHLYKECVPMFPRQWLHENIWWFGSPHLQKIKHTIQKQYVY